MGKLRTFFVAVFLISAAAWIILFQAKIIYLICGKTPPGMISQMMIGWFELALLSVAGWYWRVWREEKKDV